MSPSAAVISAVVAVVPVGALDPASEAAVRIALNRAGWGSATLVAADVFAESFDLVSVTGPAADCEGAVSLTAWQSGLDASRNDLQILAIAPALAGFLLRAIEVPCLDGAPANIDLVRVELGVATAHHYLAGEAAGDVNRASFHDREAEAAVDRAVAIGAGLSLPEDTDGDVATMFAARQAEVLAAGLVRGQVVGPNPEVSARVDGRPPSRSGAELAPGSHLVQGLDGDHAVVARAITVRPGRDVVVWVEPGGGARGPGDIVGGVASLGRGPPSAEAEILLSAAAVVAGHRTPVVFVALEPDRVALWASVDGRLTQLRADAARVDAERDSPWWIAGGIAAAWSNPDGELAGVAGLGPGFSVVVGRSLGAAWEVDVATRPTAVGRRLAPALGGGMLFQGTLPILVGARWTRVLGPVRVGAGVEAGAHLFGPFEPFQASPLFLGVVSGGPVAMPLNAEMWGGVGAGYGLAGMSIGGRWRM